VASGGGQIAGCIHGAHPGPAGNAAVQQPTPAPTILYRAAAFGLPWQKEDVMRPLSDTIGQLSALRSGHASPSDVPPGKLEPLHDFGSNPGALNAYFFVPQTVVPNPALVVVLHGCTQNAAGYDHGSGWSQVAEDNGFILLFPEQRRGNNMNLCFNWFEPGDKRRGAGEPLSICQMTDKMVTRHGIDPTRIFVNGLSAGGAMTSVMLATYPELFAGGAVIAGLPFRICWRPESPRPGISRISGDSRSSVVAGSPKCRQTVRASFRRGIPTRLAPNAVLRRKSRWRRASAR
jgi:poly(3-hydroxybutyrate) depolymerase